MAAESHREPGLEDDLAQAAVLHAIDDAEPAIDALGLAREKKNDWGNARRFLARHKRDVCYCKEWGWLVWDKQRWRVDDAAAYRLAMQTAEKIYDEAEALKASGAKETGALVTWALKSGMSARADAMLKVASAYVATDQAQFDREVYRLNVANGTIHLDEGCRLLPPRRSDLARLASAVVYDKNAIAPRWERFVREVLPDDATRLFVQIWLGYCLSGDISEQRVCVFEGRGANGKSTLLEVVARVLGEYAVVVPVETFLHQNVKSGSGASPDIARLAGARLVRASEPEPGARLSESTIKQFTGGEKMIARQMYRDFFEFPVQGKLSLSVNVKPVLVGKDHGIRRRIVVVPFTQQFPPGRGAKRGQTLVDELFEEASGILNWLLDGWRMWQEDGLPKARSIDDATASYFTEMDPIGSFLKEACEEGTREERTAASAIWSAYTRWCTQSGEDPKTQTAFGRRLSDLGYAKYQSSGVVYRLGLKVRYEWSQAGGSDANVA